MRFSLELKYFHDRRHFIETKTLSYDLRRGQKQKNATEKFLALLFTRFFRGKFCLKLLLAKVEILMTVDTIKRPFESKAKKDKRCTVAKNANFISKFYEFFES